MTVISLVVAVDLQGGMGKDNKLLCHLPADLKQFKTLTLGKPIIMGRKTFDSIGKVLPGRVNIILSRQDIEIEGALVMGSLDEALQLTSGLPEVMIIGGSEIYAQAMPLAHCIYLTKIHHQFSADVYFPHMDDRVWHCEESVDHAPDDKNQYAITFCRYRR